ncbi:SMI1/KNR4 family protein [Cystobacter fuscus]|nr:SMI1/KNR4 family protein [Cystobacter fuscus]
MYQGMAPEPNGFRVGRGDIFPFARTPGGEDLCFDYRGSPEQPRVVLVSVEGSVHPVANSFQEFMDGLYDD